MASNFYQILEANEAASQETIQSLFEQKSRLLERELEAGSTTAKEQLWFLKQAYETLSNPGKRAAYDERQKPKATANIYTRTVPAKPEGMRLKLSWKLNALLVAFLATGLIGFGLHLGRANKQDDHTAQVLQTNRGADNDATRAGTERVRVEGLVSNDAKIIDRSAELGNRALNIQQDAENRQRQEMEYRATANAEILRQQQDRLKIADEQLKWERKQYEEDSRTRQNQERMAAERIQSIQSTIRNNSLRP